MIDLWTKTFAKKAFEKRWLSRKDLERALKILYEEQQERTLFDVLIGENLLSEPQIIQLKREVDRFYRGSTVGDLNPRGMNPAALMKAVWYPKLTAYDIIEPLAEGGMGQVFRALDKKTSRSVAIKVLKDKNAFSQQRFLREIKIVKKLSHPNILPILDAGREQEWSYFTMPIVYGQDLDDWVYQKGPLAPEKAIQVMRIVTKAIIYAHSRGVIHRDLKPSNIMIDQQGAPMLTDFGLAKQMEAHTVAITQEGSLIGTPEYMPPEQACGATDWISYRADIYGLGAILYFCLTGRPPFSDDSLVNLLHQVINENPQPIEEFRKDVPEGVIKICYKCLAKHPEDRYENGKKLLKDIETFLKIKKKTGSFKVGGFFKKVFLFLLFLLLLLLIGGALCFYFYPELFPSWEVVFW